MSRSMATHGTELCHFQNDPMLTEAASVTIDNTLDLTFEQMNEISFAQISSHTVKNNDDNNKC